MFILIPPDEPIVNLETGAPVLKPDGTPMIATMQKTMAQLVYPNPYLADDGEDGAERVWRLRHAFIGARAGSVVEVDASDVKAVCAVFAKPDGDGKRTGGKCDTCGNRSAFRWHAEVASFCVPFIRAWKQASAERPAARLMEVSQ